MHTKNINIFYSYYMKEEIKETASKHVVLLLAYGRYWHMIAVLVKRRIAMRTN